MPVYEYQCKKCGREFEYQQRMSDPDKTECEACGGGLERLISRTAFQLKGGGWYKDLYSSSKPEKAASESKPAASTSSDASPSSPSPSADSSSSTSSGSSGSGDSGGSGGSSSSGGGTSSASAGAA